MIFLFLNRLLLLLLLAGGVIISLPYNSSVEGSFSDSRKLTNLISGPDTLIITDDSRPTMPPATDMLTIPLKSAGRLFMIEAIIDNQRGNLIFDSGATGLVMNRTYFRKYVRTDSQNSSGITGPVGENEKINIGNMVVSGLSFSDMTASLADLGHIENRRGIKVLGLIGFECFREFEIVIDAVNNELQLYRIDSKGNRISGTDNKFQPDITQPFEFVKNILFLKATLGGKVLRFCFDTGAETNAISSHAAKSVLSTISIERKSNLTGAGQKSTEVLFGTMNDFIIGGKKFNNMETIITHLDALNEAYGIQIDGIMGYNFLTNGTICINFLKKQFGMKFFKTEQK